MVNIPPKFEHKLRRHKQRFEKNATTIVLGKDEHLFNMIRVAMTSELQRNDAVIYVSWSSNSRHCESFTGTFSSNSRLDVRKA